MDNEANVALTREDINFLLSVLKAHNFHLKSEVKKYCALLKLPQYFDNELMKTGAWRRINELKQGEELYLKFKKVKSNLLKGVEEHAKNN